MAINDITLTAAMRQNLLSLQNTTVLMDRTSTRLTTGNKVNTPIDDPINYFAAQANTNRVSDLAVRKDGMAQAIETVKVGDNAIQSLLTLLNNAKSIANNAIATTDTASRASYATQFDTLMSQIVNIAKDAKYQGSNLLDLATLSVKFNEDGSNKLDIVGFAGTTLANLSISFTATGALANWASTSNLGMDSALQQITTAVENLRSQSSKLSTNLSIVTARQSFTNNMINTLSEGATQLTAADMNEEGANMLMLQTRQALGTTSLSLSSQAAQSVLRLF